MIFRKDHDSLSQLSTTMPASKPLNHPSFNQNPLEDYNDILEQVSVGITRGSTSVTSFKQTTVDKQHSDSSLYTKHERTSVFSLAISYFWTRIQLASKLMKEGTHG